MKEGLLAAVNENRTLEGLEPQVLSKAAEHRNGEMALATVCYASPIPPRGADRQEGFMNGNFERNDPMWCVGDVDMKVISALGVGADVAFSFGSFFAGVVVSIFINYGGAENLSDLNYFLWHRLSWFLAVISLACFLSGIVFSVKKTSIWEEIKKHSKPVM
jgi:hypothetical protein